MNQLSQHNRRTLEQAKTLYKCSTLMHLFFYKVQIQHHIASTDLFSLVRIFFFPKHEMITRYLLSIVNQNTQNSKTEQITKLTSH